MAASVVGVHGSSSMCISPASDRLCKKSVPSILVALFSGLGWISSQADRTGGGRWFDFVDQTDFKYICASEICTISAKGICDMKKGLAEFIGTFTLVFIACGAAIFAGEYIGFLGIAFAFGLALIGMAYGIGPISGCHINPAVSVGVFTAGRMSAGDLVTYVIAQVAGAIVATFVLYVIANGNAEPYTGGFAGNEMLNGYTIMAGLVFEIVATFLFVVVILGATQASAPASMAGLAIGLTLVAIHLVGIPITNTSVNPARSIGPALFQGGAALAQLWLFIVAPIIGGLLAGLLFRGGTLEADTE